MKPHNPWTPEETARFLASASARQAQLEARVQLLAKALRDVILSESGELDRVQTAMSIASQALHEAGLNEQKEG
jgi:hypothetical protein